MNFIDTHHHFLPPRYVDVVGEAAIAGLLVSGRIPEWSSARSLVRNASTAGHRCQPQRD
jgi:hypothetical protein